MQAEEFGRYTLTQRLAVGGMAEIFLASLRGDAGFSKKVVVKRILPHLGADDSFVRMFIDEALLAARLTHPNVIQVYDFGTIDGSHFIAMEYVEGVDLHTLLRLANRRGRRLNAAEVACIGEGVARGLAYTHDLTDEQGIPLDIVHRDVSPQNIMVSSSGTPKVMDFGIAKAAARATRTATGTIRGKLSYMSPEQALGSALDKRSDQFSLGVVLWECLTGERLFVSTSDVNLIQTVAAGHVRPLREVRSDVPPALEALIMRALSHDPADRFADLHVFSRELAAFRYTLGAAGMADLGGLLEAVKPDGAAQRADWSWADQNATPASTRRIAAPKFSTTLPPPLPKSTTRPETRRSLGTRRRAVERLERRRLLMASGVALLTLGICVPIIMWTAASQSAAAAFRAPDPMSQSRSVTGLGTGGLSLRTDGPRVKVYLGSRYLGTTPLFESHVPAGRLHLRLLNASTGVSRRVEVYVPANGVTEASVSGS